MIFVIKNKLISIFIFVTCSILATSTYATEKCNENATQCTSLIEVRESIDVIDAQLVKLIGKRLAYVKKAGEIKSGSVSVHDQSRENKILKRVGLLAEQQGYSAEIAEAIFKTILQQANLYEIQTDAKIR